MCKWSPFHKWNKWEQYDEHGVCSGGLIGPKEPTPYTERRQRRTCERCGKEQDEMVMGS